MAESIIVGIICAIFGGLVVKYWEEIYYFLSFQWVRRFPRSRTSYKHFFKSLLQKSMKKIKKEAFVGTYNKVDIQVIHTKEPDLDIVDDVLILHVSTNLTPSENAKRLLETYCKKILIGKVQDCLNTSQKKSVIDFSAKELSKTLGRLKIVEDFEWQVAVESQGNPGYKEYITKYEQVRKNGLFFSIFLPEIQSLGKIITPDSMELVPKEYGRFLNFLYRIAIKEREEKVRLQFSGKLSKIAVMLVAHDITWQHGINPYLKRANELINKGFETIYIVAAGNKVESAKKVTTELSRQLPVKSYPKKDVKIIGKNMVRIYKLTVNI